jgi:hypothetical protein
MSKVATKARRVSILARPTRAGPDWVIRNNANRSGAREDAWDTFTMASPTLIVLFTVFECVALLFIVLGVPLMSAKASLNVPSRFQSISMARESAEWRAVNAAAGRDLVAIGVTLATIAPLMLLAGARLDVFALAGCGWLALGATGILAHGIVMMARHPHY